MDSLVYIIHGSAIVRIGLSGILRKYFKCRIEMFSHLDDFQETTNLKSYPVIFFIDEDTAKSKPYLQLINVATEIKSFTIVNRYTEPDNIMKELSISLYNSPEKIYEQVKNTFEQPATPKSQTEGLTNRETEVLKLVALGFANKEIAEKLFISTHTVISHRKNITEKLGVKSISGLTVYAIINDIIDTSNIDLNDLI